MIRCNIYILGGQGKGVGYYRGKAIHRINLVTSSTMVGGIRSNFNDLDEM